MADLATRLESSYTMLGDPLHKEAADEIKRLRMLLEAGGGRYWEGRYRDEAALVDKLQEALLEVISVSDRQTDIYDRAKSLLGEKKDD
jgi:hypothetical protein